MQDMTTTATTATTYAAAPASQPRPVSPGTPELYEPQTKPQAKRKRRGLIDPDKLPGGRRTEWSSDED